MLFFLRKFIEALLLPIGISGLMIVAGVVFRRRWIAIGGVVTLYAFSTPFMGELMLRTLERVYEPRAVAESPNADAIVVLSGGIVRGTTVSGVQWGHSANRYFAGLDLATAGKARFLIISTGMSTWEGLVLRKHAILHGIQPDRIIVTSPVSTTQDEALAVSEIPDIHSILLVTSAFHMPRAAMLFRARRLAVTPFPTDERVIGRRNLNWGEFIPIAAGLQSAESAMREYYGLAVYRMILPFRPAPVRR